MKKDASSMATVTRSGERNTNERFSILPIALGALILFVGWQMTVQAFAFFYNYHSDLGQAVFQVGQHKIYAPVIWLAWTYSSVVSGVQMTKPILAMEAGIISSLLLAIAFGCVSYYRRSLKAEKVDDIHGSARFADDEDVLSMKLIAAEKATEANGVIIGAYKFEDGRIEFLRYNEAAHIFGAAPTRSGKGVSLVLPTLLTYPSSVFINDVKNENYELSSGFRHKAGSLCIRLDPTHVPSMSIDGTTEAVNTARWNVLDEIRLWTRYDVMDAQNVAQQIADPDSKGMEDHWVSTSYELLTGLFLHVCYAERNKSLAGCGVYLADPSFASVEQMFERMLNTAHDPDLRMGWTDSEGKPTKTHPQVAIAARSMLNKEERERNSVLSTAKTRLALYTEPIVGQNTATSDFRVDDLMNLYKSVSFYMVVPPSDKERLRPFIRLFIGFYIRRATASMRFEDGASAADYMHRLMMMIDELPALRKLDALQDGLGYLAGYGVTAYMLVQDLPQLTSKDNGYGEDESIRSGSHVQIYFTPNSTKTAEEISRKLGERTVEKQKVNFSGQRFAPVMDHMNVSVEEVKRPLLAPDEVAHLPADKSIIFLTNEHPILGEKVPYYKVPELLRRAKLPAPMRVGYSWRNLEKPGIPLEGNWLMVSADSIEGVANEFWAAINVYKPYPAVQVTLKQLVLSTGELLTVDADLIDDDGRCVTGELSEEITDYRIRWDASAGLDPREAFEVHMRLREPLDKPEFRETGFFAALSIYEREARQLTRELLFKEEEKTKKEAKPRFVRLRPNIVCIGEVFLVTEHCVVTRGKEDALFVHRVELLSTVPAVGDRVLIRYQDRVGTVEAR